MSFFSLMDGNWRVPKKFVNVLNIFYYEYLEFECVLGICSHIILSMLSKKYSVSISPTNEVWIFMYKFIDFDHFQSMRGNQIFHKIMWFLLFLCVFFFWSFDCGFYCYSSWPNRFGCFESNNFKSLFRQAENDSYYRMLLSLLFSERMLSDQNAFGRLDGNAFPSSFVGLFDSFLTWKAVAVNTRWKVFFSFGWPLHSKQRKNFLISLALGKLLLLQTFVEKTLLFLNKINTVV